MASSTKDKETKEKKKINRERFLKRFKKNNELTEAFKENEKIYYKKKKTYYIKRISLIVVSLLILILLSNRTFFKENYKTQKINIKIPLLTFFIKDDGNELVLKTLRKTRYVQEFFDEQLSNMTRYRCNGYSFYYDDNNGTAIYVIKVEKSIFLKTITVSYAKGNADCLCDYGSNKDWNEIEKTCKND